MRLYSIHLMAAVTLFACVEASALESQLEPTLPETSGHGHTPDQTFPQNGTNSVDEERMPSSNVVRGIGEATHSMESMGSNFAERAQQLKEELKGKSAQEAFAYLKLHEAGDDVFRSPDFLHWEYFGTGAQREDTYEAMAEVLLAHFDSSHLAKMLHAAEKVEETKVIATELQKARFAVWTRKCEKELGLTSLKRLGPDLNSDDLFRNSPFPAWDMYVDLDYPSVRLDEYKMLLRVLLDRYNEFDLAKAFHAAMEIDELKSTAECLQRQLGWHWKATRPAYDEMFVGLGLDPTSDGFLGSRLFRTWYLYVESVEHHYNSRVVEVLKARLSDFGLAKMLDAAKKVRDTEAIADDLEYAYMYEWRYKKRDELFNDLGLDAKSDDLLGNPLFKIWHKFARLKWSTLEVMRFLKTCSDEVGLAKMLFAASQVKDTKMVATWLLKELFNDWNHNKHSESTANELVGLRQLFH